MEAELKGARDMFIRTFTFGLAKMELIHWIFPLTRNATWMQHHDAKTIITYWCHSYKSYKVCLECASNLLKIRALYRRISAHKMINHDHNRNDTNGAAIFCLCHAVVSIGRIHIEDLPYLYSKQTFCWFAMYSSGCLRGLPEKGLGAFLGFGSEFGFIKPTRENTSVGTALSSKRQIQRKLPICLCCKFSPFFNFLIYSVQILIL